MRALTIPLLAIPATNWIPAFAGMTNKAVSSGFLSIVRQTDSQVTFEKLLLVSLRGAKRRGNLFNIFKNMRLLHFVRNDTCAVFQRSESGDLRQASKLIHAGDIMYA